MRCPFIREATVKWCRASSVRKMILESATDADHERCSSPAYAQCPAYASRPAPGPAAQCCPFLQETFVEYCSAAAVTRYIPATEGLLPRCNSDRHRYCELFLGQADPLGDRLPHQGGAGATPSGADRAVAAGEIVVPEHLSYAPNHMWLDVAVDGCCHVGVDAFLTSVVGDVQRITFAATKTVDRPVAVLTVNGVDLQLVFPKPLEEIVPNSHMRSSPSKVVSDPYGAGWLFEATDPTHGWCPVTGDAEAALIPGDAARRWIRAESDRLTAFVHDRISRPDASGARLMADGGGVEAGLAAHLGRDDLVSLFHEFFSPLAGWRRAW
jgi:glycine cleavage system H lipoate-binding protein